MAAAAAVGAIVSALAAISAYKIATQSIKAAYDANRISQENNRTQLRAYLYVSHGPWLTLDPSTKQGAEVKIHHSGATPAYKIRLNAIPEIGPYLLNQAKLSDVLKMQGIESFEYAILYGNEPIRQTIAFSFPWETLQLVKPGNRADGEQRFYLHGIVRYLDIFGIETPATSAFEHKYEFCFTFHPDKSPDGSERGCEPI